MKLSDFFNLLKMNFTNLKEAIKYFCVSAIMFIFCLALFYHYPTFANITIFVLIIFFYMSILSFITIAICLYEKAIQLLAQRRKKRKEILRIRAKYKNYYPEEVWDVITQLVNNGNISIKVNKSTFEQFESRDLVFPKQYQTHDKCVMDFEFSKGGENTPIEESELTEKEKAYRTCIGYGPLVGARYVNMNDMAYREIKESCFQKKTREMGQNNIKCYLYKRYGN